MPIRVASLRRHLLPLSLAALLLGCAALGLRVAADPVPAWDAAVLRALADWKLANAHVARWTDQSMRDLTALGGTTVLTLLVLAAFVTLLLRGDRRQALVLAAAAVSGKAAESGLKLWVARARPRLFEHGDFTVTPSFPSGHAMMGMLIFLLLALVTTLHVRRSLRPWVLGLGVGTGLAVGASRVWLGVHWPTDVLAGWGLGAAWALAAGRLLAVRGQDGPGG